MMLEWKLGLLILGGAVFTVGCLVPNRWLPANLPNDKLMHFAAFAVLGVLALSGAQSHAQALVWMIGLSLAGGAIECLQQLVPDRGFSWRDIAANVAGVLFAGAAVQLYMFL